MATVGWRGGTRTNPDGTVQSPNNGVYRSSSGSPNTFTRLSANGFTAQDRIGRVELRNAVGDKQDHDPALRDRAGRQAAEQRRRGWHRRP